MADLLQNGDFEVPGGWTEQGFAWRHQPDGGSLNGTWAYLIAPAYDVPSDAWLPSWIEQQVPVARGRGYLVRVSARPGTDPSTMDSAIALRVVDPETGAPTEVARITPADVTIGAWSELAGTFVATGAAVLFQVHTEGGAGGWDVDQAVMVDAPPVGSSASRETLLANVTAVIAACDPNIGRVFAAAPRWRSLKELADAASFALASGSLLDDFSRRGRKVTRFWMLDAKTTSTWLTLSTRQDEHVVTLRGFFQQEQEEPQDVTLQRAAALIVAGLTAEQHSALAAGMGDGYMGFLDSPPTQEETAQPARLGESEVRGCTVVLELHVAEEVTA